MIRKILSKKPFYWTNRNSSLNFTTKCSYNIDILNKRFEQKSPFDIMKWACN
ncbi:unnamed protein product, partial [marine sediment metagenome]